MKLVNAQNRIQELMSRFVAQIEMAAAMSRTDLNKAAETVLMPLLNEVYGWNLENINYAEDNNNYPGIDLADEAVGISIQVTATPTLAKVKHTLEQFTKHSQYLKYNRLIIFILKKKQDSYSETTIQRIIQNRFDFNPQENIWDYRNILKEVSNFQIDKTLRVQKILEANFGDEWLADIEKLQQEAKFILGEIRTDIGGLTLDRSDVLAEALEKLSSTSLLEISGAPGVGKSAVLKDIAELQKNQEPIMVLSGDRITGTGWNGYASHLQLTQPLDKLLLALSNGTRSTIFIDGIDRITEQGKRSVINDLFRALAELSVNENNSSRWLVVYSAREENIQDVYWWLNWQVLGKPMTLQVPELTLDELQRVVEHSPRIKPLLYLEQLSPVLKNPLMLSLLEDVRMLPNSEELPPLATEIEISRVWWERMIGDEGSVTGRDRKNSLLRVGRRVVRSPGKLFPAEDDISPESIISLTSDRTLLQDPERELYRFSHDLLEDWVMYRVLEQHREELPAYLQEIGEPFGLYRAVQLLGVALLENSETADVWIQRIEEIEQASQISSRWRQALLTAPLISPRANELLNKAESLLIANNAQRLIELMVVLRTAEVMPNFSLIPLSAQTKQELANQLMPLFMSDPIPRWSVWKPFMGWLIKGIHELPISVRSEATELMEIWQTRSPVGSIYRKEIGEIAMMWLRESESGRTR